ncbi:MAG: Hsp70 family protein [Bacteroidales bacterium]|nr:Hsp70 family protein [Bacteroidales bacterium]
MTILGIDLGTTYCTVAHLDDRGRAVTLPNADGEILTPSAIYLNDTGDAVVGQPAMDLALEEPDRVATLVKRRMGYAEYGRTVAGRGFRPETLAAVILRKLVQDAERHVGPVREAVITVPAYFDDTRRQATIDAGRIAGLDVLDILDEPSAAALAYTFQIAPGADLPGDGPRTVLVYDLGGGTFDVTLVKLGKKRFQVLGIEGDVRLGGKDWDDRLVNHVAEQFHQQFGQDPRHDPQTLAMLQASAERAKRTLSKVEQASVTVAHGGQKMQVPVTRTEFEGLTRDLLLRTRLTTQQVLNSASLSWDRVDKLLLVGGSTHMPMAARMLEELTGQAPDRSLAVSEVVARGAALHAGIVMARREREQNLAATANPLGEVVEISVNAHSLGVEVRKGEERLNDRLIPKNTQLPATATRTYFTAKDGQTKVRVRVLQGEAHQAAACIPVGECWIEGLPEGLPKGARVDVQCGVAANGCIKVTAIDRTSGRRTQAEIHRQGGLSAADLQHESEWVRGLKIQ